MSSTEHSPVGDMTMDTSNLFREDVITDLQVGMIKRLVPVNPDGTTDKRRQTMFVGQTQLMSNMGPLPVSCSIEAKSLQEAIQKFPQAIQKAVNEMVEQVKEAQRKEASRIVVPGVEATQRIITGE